MHATDHIAQLTFLFYETGLMVCRLNLARSTQVVQGQEVIVFWAFFFQCDHVQSCSVLQVGTDRLTLYLAAYTASFSKEGIQLCFQNWQGFKIICSKISQI